MSIISTIPRQLSHQTLAQLVPSATTLTDFYTVGATGFAIATSLMVANRSGTAASFRVSIAVDAAADATKQYIYYDIPVPPNETFLANFEIPLTALDVVRIYASSTNLSFTLFGQALS